MTRNQMRLRALAAEISRDGATQDLLTKTVLALITEVLDLQRQLDRIESTARRAESQSRRFTAYYR